MSFDKRAYRHQLRVVGRPETTPQLRNVGTRFQVQAA